MTDIDKYVTYPSTRCGFGERDILREKEHGVSNPQREIYVLLKRAKYS